ncbi:MAG: hypothetical protein RL732_609 [Bacteroidota bacterium]|jgi:hypothetical protein
MIMPQFMPFNARKILFVFSAVLAFTASSLAQTFPAPNNCASKDLDLIETLLMGATTGSVSPGNRKMQLTVANKTTSDRRSFSVWGTLKRYDISGALVGTQNVYFCVDSVKKNATMTLKAKDSVYFGADQELVLTNIYTAWSSAKGTENCDYLFTNSSKISPNCAVKSDFKVYTGVNSRFKSTRANCETGKGKLKIAPFGGKAPYTVSVSAQGSSVQINQTITDSTELDLPPGIYNVTVVDGKFNNSIWVREVEAPAPLDKPISSITHPDCNLAKGNVKVTNLTSGYKFTLESNYLRYTSTDGNFSDVEPDVYRVTASKAFCSVFDSVKVNKRPFVPAKPQFSITQTTCTESKGMVSLLSQEPDVIYSIVQSASIKFSPDANGQFKNMEAGDYAVMAESIISSCTNGAKATINQQPPTPATPTYSSSDPSLCEPKGKVTITGPLSANHEYSKDGGKFWQTSNEFIVDAGVASDISLQVRNKYGCISTPASIIGVCDMQNNTLITGAAATRKNAVAAEQLPAISQKALSVVTMANSFKNGVRFMITAPRAGNGVLELYDTNGKKIKTLYQGSLNAGLNYFDLSLPENSRSAYVYLMSMGEQKVSGQVTK